MSAVDIDAERPLSVREEQLLYRLLSDPTKLPMPFKTWLISYLEGSDLSLPLSSVNSLNQRLQQQIVQRTLTGRAVGTTDVNGFLRVDFDAPVKAVETVVLTNTNFPQLNCSFSAVSWDSAGFYIAVWYLIGNHALANADIDVAWLAIVTP